MIAFRAALRLAASLLLALAAPTVAAASEARPNVIVILADDLGYSDLGCFGGEIRTPHLDALSRRGLRFTQFYNGGRCCPTRASLLTGLYPHQAGVGRMTADTGLPGYRGFLTDNTVTIPEVLRASGYRTAMVGKWHLSLTKEGPGHMKRLNNKEIADTFSDPKTYPAARGFEEHYGVIWGVVNYFDPFSLVHNFDPVREVPKGYYITDALNDHAVQFIEKYGKGPEPFFLYVAHTAPHWPLHAPEEDVARYEPVYKAGWDAVREARHRRMLEKGILPAGSPLPPRPAAGKTWQDNPTKDWDARAMAVHAAMVERMDHGVGRMVHKLEQMKLLDNTLILFLSDNGASPEVYPNSGFDRPSQTRDGRKIAYPPGKSVMPGSDETFFYMGPAWANVSNTPLRYWKAEMHEGGICTPLVAHWPAGMKAERGSITHEPGHVIDVMATCVDLARAEYPKEFQGRRITPAEGKSLTPTLRGERREGHDVLAWEHYGAKAIRQGDWKLVARKNGAWELYNVSKDRSELNDQSARRPELAADLEAMWARWAGRANVYPSPDGAARAAAPATRPAGGRAGRVRVDGHSLVDDDGPFLGLGASCFTALWRCKHDRPRLEADLAFLSRQGFNYYRMLSMVGHHPGWDGREIAPVSFTRRDDKRIEAWPDYWRQLRELIDLAYDRFGMRTQITIFADAQLMPDKKDRVEHMRKILADVVPGREHKIIMLEVANEAWQNGFPEDEGVADLREFAKYLNDRTEIPVAITSNHDWPDLGSPKAFEQVYRGAAADLATWHFTRDRRTDGGWKPVYDCWESGDRPGLPPVSSNEPIGPGSSVNAEKEPVRLVMAAAFAYAAKLPMYVFHSEAGVFGRSRFQDMPAIDRFKHVTRLLPADLPNWQRNDGKGDRAPFTAFAGGKADRYWPQVESAKDGCVRNTGSRKGDRFVCVPIGIRPGGLQLEARHALKFTAHDPLTGEALKTATMRRGERLTLPPGPGALLIVGRVLGTDANEKAP